MPLPPSSSESKDNIKYLVDLNGDGKVDSADLEILKTHLVILEDAKRNGTPVPIDLNGDGDVNESEGCWPLIDFAGAGKALLFRSAGPGRSRRGPHRSANARGRLDRHDQGLQGGHERGRARAIDCAMARGTRRHCARRQRPRGAAQRGGRSDHGLARGARLPLATLSAKRRTRAMRVSVPFTGLVVAVGASMLAFGMLRPMPSASAQDVRGEVTRAVDELRKSNQSIAVEVDRSTGLPTSIKGLTPRPDPSIALTATRSLGGEPSEDDVRRAVEAFMATSQIRSAFPQGNAQERKVVTQVRRDPDIKGEALPTSRSVSMAFPCSVPPPSMWSIRPWR